MRNESSTSRLKVDLTSNQVNLPARQANVRTSETAFTRKRCHAHTLTAMPHSVSGAELQQPQEIGPDHPEWTDHVLRAWSDDRLGTQPATVLLGIDGDELEKRAIERNLPLNSYHEHAKASEAYGRALAAEMAPFNFPAKYDEKEREILRLWGMGTLSTDQASRFLYMRPEDMPARARFLRIPASNEQSEKD
ncbi:hypothetical protein [Rhizobium leguminosarum]